MADNTPESTIRKLTQVLAILARQNGGEIRVKRAHMRKLNEESFRIFEDIDDRKDELVLRFDSKHAAIYAVEAECPKPSATSVAAMPAQPQPRLTNQPASPGSSLPFSDEQLARAEKKIAAMRNLNAIRKERPPTA